MNEMKILFAAFLFAACPAFAAFEDITLEKYPDADCVMADGLQETVYNADGTYVETDEQWVKILTEKGRREESEIAMRYNLRYGQGKIDFVSVIGLDGTERAIDVSATTKEATDNSSASVNIYDPMSRRLVCTVPDVKVGETIHYKTRREIVRSRVENQLADLAILEWACPIVRQTIRFKGPAERPLKRHAIRHPLGNVTFDEKTEADGSHVYTWVVKDSPQAFPEPEMPPMYTQLQNLRVSTAEDWPQLSRWYWELCVPHLEKTNAAITNKVNELVANLGSGTDEATQLAKINAVYKWVAQEIRYMGLTMEDTSPGYAPHDVNITFDNRYGVCRDKAGLLVAMLRLAGLDAYPVLIHADAKMDDEVPSPYFNHAIVCVKAPGAKAANKDGFILMDPTDESSRDLLPAYLSNRSYLVAHPVGETLHTSQIPSADDNAVRVRSEGTLEKDGSVLLSSTIDITGFNDNVYRGSMLRRKLEERRQLFERVARNAAPGAELLSFELTPTDLQDTATPLQVKLLVRVPETLLRGESRDEFTPPFLTTALGAANWLLDGNTALAHRRFPLDVSTTASVDETLVVKLEGNVGAPLVLPEEEKIDGPYEFHRSFAVADGVLTAKRRLAVNAVEFSPTEYDKLREDIKAVEAAERKRPVFGKDALTGANVRIRSIRRDYDFTSPYAWTVTNTVVKEILTYDGKKKNSELKYTYNPTWKNVELLSAVVSNANGKVSSVSEKETNVFDCSWASKAPRYPASKELVVNLPSVEVGSVITYTTVTTVTNSPAAYYGIFYEDVLEPTDEIITRFGDETFVTKNPKLRKAEPMQPDGRLWRSYRHFSKGDFATLGQRLLPATEVKAIDPRTVLGDVPADLAAIRNWMAKNIRVAGPALYEVPLADQLTDPAIVLAERYATRLDYVRTLAALLKGAGYAVDILFSSDDATVDPIIADWDLYDRNERAYASALCRVTVRTGGFLGFGGTTETYYLGTENEYTPLGTTVFDGSRAFDPKTGEFAVVRAVSDDAKAWTETTYKISIRENGAADIDVKEVTYGPAVGAFRKQYVEMLPEDRSRHYQELLGALSQAADATQDLITDTDGYPATRTFSCYVPHFATVDGDAITVSLPEIGNALVPLTGSLRETPIAFPAFDPANLRLEVTFPKGYTEIEHLADSFTVFFPTSGSYQRDYSFGGMLNEAGDVWTAYLGRERPAGQAGHINPQYFDHIKAMNRKVTSRATRTITVRKAK